MFLDIGVLLTDGWDRHARKRAATNFKLEVAEMEDRHHLTFDPYEEGKLTMEEYLRQVVFYQDRSFTRAQFRRFMFAQSKPYPEMIELVAQLEVRHGLKVGAVNNEAHELNAYRIRRSKLDGFMDFFISSCPVHLRTRCGHLSNCPGHRPNTSPSGSVYRPDIRPDRGRFGDTKHSPHRLQIHVRQTGFVRIAEWRKGHPLAVGFEASPLDAMTLMATLADIQATI